MHAFSYLCEKLLDMNDNIHENWIDFDENDNAKQIDETINEVVHSVMHNPALVDTAISKKKKSEVRKKDAADVSAVDVS